MLKELLGGRGSHHINLRVGGFYKLPEIEQMQKTAVELQKGLDSIVDLVELTAALPIPEFEIPLTFVALQNPDEYPMERGRVISSDGLNISPDQLEKNIIEEQLLSSNALHAKLKDGSAYNVGCMARFNLNFKYLNPIAKQLATKFSLHNGCRNPYKSIVIRSIELINTFGRWLATQPYFPEVTEYQESTGSF